MTHTTPAMPTGTAPSRLTPTTGAKIVAPTQLHLPPAPGYCAAPYCTNRISVANTDGICDDCNAVPLTVAATGFVCIECRTVPVKAYHSRCHHCRHAHYNREKRAAERVGLGARQFIRATLDKEN